MSPIFISHASADKTLADSLFDLLQTGCNLRQEDIVCTSVDGAGIETGQEFIAWIKDKLEISDFAILVITPNYFVSKFCMAEMGAVWALEKRVFPIVIPNISREVGVVMLGRQTAEINESGLDAMRDELVNLFPDVEKSTARWNAKKQLFLASLGATLEKLPQPNIIERAALRQEQEKNEAFVQMLQEMEMQLAQQRDHIAKLEQLKDKEAVDEIKLGSLPSGEKYHSLLQNVTKELRDFSLVETRCLYALFVGDWWYPSHEAWQDWGKEIEVALKSRWINQRRDENVYMANESRPRYKSAIIAIERLGEHIGQMDERLKTAIEEKEKYEVDIHNLEYWSRAMGETYLLRMG